MSTCCMSSVNQHPSWFPVTFNRHNLLRGPSCPVHAVEEHRQGTGGHASSKNHGPPHAIDAQFQGPQATTAV